jgi:ubiquinone biosynthesis O-methyltransferase
MVEAEPVCDIPGLGPEAYARWRASGVGAITERLERRLILELVGDARGRSVLDVGCGDGDLAVELSKRGANVVGIDASDAMIEAAKHRAERDQVDVDFRVATAQHLPFPAEQFDIVVAVTILCFVDDAVPVFKEMARVLRPGGQLVIGELGKRSSWAAARRIRGWLGSPLWRKGRFRRAGELRELANQAALVARPVRGAVYYPRFGLAAKALAPLDRAFSRLTTVGAAFLALCTD